MKCREYEHRKWMKTTMTHDQSQREERDDVLDFHFSECVMNNRTYRRARRWYCVSSRTTTATSTAMSLASLYTVQSTLHSHWLTDWLTDSWWVPMTMGWVVFRKTFRILIYEGIFSLQCLTITWRVQCTPCLQCVPICWVYTLKIAVHGRDYYSYTKLLLACLAK